MGLFGVAEILLTVEQPLSPGRSRPTSPRCCPRARNGAARVGAIGRGTGIGFFLGLIPGVGAIIPTFIAYVVEKRISKTPERFGQGAIEGVAAPETANNAYANAAMIPLLTLGIPSSPTIAVLMGAFIINGLTPGPFLFQERPDLVWAVIASFFLGNILLLILNLPLVGLWARILHLPYQYVCVGTLLFCVIGAYSLQQNVFDVGVMIVCGIIGYGMRKIDMPIAPLVLGLILGPFIEKSLRTSLEMSARRLLDFLHPAPVSRAAGVGGCRPRRLGAAAGAGRGARGVNRVNDKQRKGGTRHVTLRNSLIAAAIVLAALTGAAPAQQDYPTRPIQLMVAFPAGGSTDIGAASSHPSPRRRSGQPIVVVNKGGAGGQVGWTELVRQKPDGYYIGFINLPATNTVILDPERKAIFTEKDFTPIINQVLDPGVIWVRADSPYKTVQDLIDAAKKSPSTIRAATTGILSDDHLAILMTEEAAPGAKFRIVHLEGGAAQFKEIMAGNIDVAFDNVGSIVPRVKSGEVRALAVMDDVRSKFLPDVPTTKELGYPTVISNSTRGIAGPKGMPAPIVAKLRDVLQEGDGRPRARQEARGPGHRHQDHGRRRVRQVFRRHACQGEEIHRVGQEPAAEVADRREEGGRRCCRPPSYRQSGVLGCSGGKLWRRQQ